MKKFERVVFAALTVIAAVSCSKDFLETKDDVTGKVIILNNGSFQKNNASISLYDPDNGEVSGSAFASVNKTGLGDTAQDIIAVGDDDLYISVNESKVIFQTDRKLHIKRTVNTSLDGTTLSPRYLCKDGGKVYVSFYEGYLGQMDHATHSFNLTPVGPNPDQIAVLDGKVYVANSGGLNYPAYNNTVSVVDTESFKETSTIEVNVNPSQIAVAGGKVYVMSFGDYGAAPAKVQCIDPSTQSVTDMDIASPSAIASYDNVLYVLCGGYDENWAPLPGSIYRFDGSTFLELTTPQTRVPAAYSLSVTEKGIWVGSSDYTNTGDVYFFDRSGESKGHFDCKGINPIKVIE